MTRDADYVTGPKGRYKIQPPIVHPAHCVCSRCARRRGRDEWDRPVAIRILRHSPFPTHRPKSAAYALDVKKREEQLLRDAVAAAEAQRKARPHQVTFGRLCDSYRAYMQKEGKRYDRTRYPIANIENFLGRDRDPAKIGWDEYRELCAEVSALSTQTQRHYASILLAILNHAVAERLIPSHNLPKVRRPRVFKSTRPVTWSEDEVGVLLGPAMAEYERDQAKWNQTVARGKASRSLRTPSVVPLRGLCYIAYFTLMRPTSNKRLTWSEISLDAKKDKGRFELKEHKNKGKGIPAVGPLQEQLVRYLRSIRPTGNPAGPVHANPETGEPYVDIRKQWNRLVAIANKMLPGDAQLEGEKAEFFTWRHTGASHLAKKSKNPVLIVRMMGDTNITTVMKHYFDLDFESMEEMIQGWEVPGISGGEEEGEREWPTN